MKLQLASGIAFRSVDTLRGTTSATLCALNSSINCAKCERLRPSKKPGRSGYHETCDSQRCYTFDREQKPTWLIAPSTPRSTTTRRWWGRDSLRPTRSPLYPCLAVRVPKILPTAKRRTVVSHTPRPPGVQANLWAAKTEFWFPSAKSARILEVA
jgi:hypothetical protein